MKPDELVRMLAPSDPAAKRRLARVLSEVATVASAPHDGEPVLVLRDTTNSATNVSLDHDASSVSSSDPSLRRRRGRGLPPNVPSLVISTSGLSASALSEASTRS